MHSEKIWVIQRQTSEMKVGRGADGYKVMAVVSEEKTSSLLLYKAPKTDPQVHSIESPCPQGSCQGHRV